MLKFSPINTICSLRIITSNCCNNCRWSSIHRVTPIVSDINLRVRVSISDGASISVLQITMNFHFLINSLITCLIKSSLMRIHIFFLSLWRLWLKWPECIGSETTNYFHIILNFRCNFIISHERTTDRPLAIAFFVLTFTFPLVALCELVLSWVIVLNILHVLVLVHSKRRDVCDWYLVILNISSRISCCLWSNSSTIWITWSRLPMRSDELDSTSTSLVQKTLHKRIASLLAASLSQRIFMHRLRAHLPLSLFPAIFQIIRSRALIKS